MEHKQNVIGHLCAPASTIWLAPMGFLQWAFRNFENGWCVPLGKICSEGREASFVRPTDTGQVSMAGTEEKTPGKSWKGTCRPNSYRSRLIFRRYWAVQFSNSFENRILLEMGFG